MRWVPTDITDIIGQEFTAVTSLEKGSQEIIFEGAPDPCFLMTHMQECCEVVLVEEIAGDPEWLLNSPITRAAADCYEDQGGTSTFYRFSTAKGTVTVRWYGSSGSGVYGEAVSLYRKEPYWS